MRLPSLAVEAREIWRGTRAQNRLGGSPRLEAWNARDVQVLSDTMARTARTFARCELDVVLDWAAESLVDLLVGPGIYAGEFNKHVRGR